MTVSQTDIQIAQAMNRSTTVTPEGDAYYLVGDSWVQLKEFSTPEGVWEIIKFLQENPKSLFSKCFDIALQNKLGRDSYASELLSRLSVPFIYEVASQAAAEVVNECVEVCPVCGGRVKKTTSCAAFYTGPLLRHITIRVNACVDCGEVFWNSEQEKALKVLEGVVTS